MQYQQLYVDLATIGTAEYSLPGDTTTLPVAITTDVFGMQTWLDLNALTDAEVYLIQFKEKIDAAGTQRIFHREYIPFAQTGSPHWTSLAFNLMHGWDVTLTKIAGTDRSIPWSIRGFA